jgi:UDP-N-acetylmuramoyl-tripeptide--D-alanyl-D-alanine ligase
MSESAMQIDVHTIAQLCGGVLNGAGSAMISSVVIDSRAVTPGALFVALIGERADGHDYLDAAQRLGANAALVSRPIAHALPQIVVPDTQLALAAFARAWAQRMPALRIALTGSNGKTTVKNLTQSILATRGECAATLGNLNNELGLPLTVLRLRPEHAFAVLEMGAGQVGDIAYLTDIARPNVALVNNAMAAHLERLGSVHGVALEKSAIYRALGSADTAVFNLDDAEYATFLAAAANAKTLRFSLLNPAADVYASDIVLGAQSLMSRVPLGSQFTLHCPLGSTQIELALIGEHNVRNALAAAALAYASGATLAQIRTGLQSARATSGRLMVRAQPAGWTLLDDSYNANPGSVTAGIDALVTLPGAAWVVLGSMAELGADSARLHEEIGAYAAHKGVQRLLCLGPNASLAALRAGSIGQTFEELESLVAVLKAQLHPGVNLLVKGSRSARMERVLAALCDSPPTDIGAH